MLDAGFTQEELDSCIDSIEFEFNRYMPKRLDNESIEDYLQRYRSLVAEDKVADADGKDYAKILYKYAPYLLIVGAPSFFYSADYYNFIRSVFMISLINTSADYMPADYVKNILGMSESVFRIVESNVYSIDYCYEHGSVAQEILGFSYNSAWDDIFSASYTEYLDTVLHIYDDLSNMTVYFNALAVINEKYLFMQDRVLTNEPFSVSVKVRGENKLIRIEDYDASNLLDDLKEHLNRCNVELKL